MRCRGLATAVRLSPKSRGSFGCAGCRWPLTLSSPPCSSRIWSALLRARPHLKTARGVNWSPSMTESCAGLSVAFGDGSRTTPALEFCSYSTALRALSDVLSQSPRHLVDLASRFVPACVWGNLRWGMGGGASIASQRAGDGPVVTLVDAAEVSEAGGRWRRCAARGHTEISLIHVISRSASGR